MILNCFTGLSTEEPTRLTTPLIGVDDIPLIMEICGRYMVRPQTQYVDSTIAAIASGLHSEDISGYNSGYSSGDSTGLLLEDMDTTKELNSLPDDLQIKMLQVL